MPPPTIVYAQENFWSTWFIPLAALLFGAVAARYAYLSYLGILKQIGLANDQVALANRQLKLAESQLRVAEREIDLVGRDLEITTRQAGLADAERAKKPDPVIVFGNNTDEIAISAAVSPPSPDYFPLEFFIWNRGDRAIFKTEVILYTPMLLVPIQAKTGRVHYDPQAMQFSDAKSQKPRHRWTQIVIDATVAANSRRPIGHAMFGASAGEEYVILWKIVADGISYPPGNEEGELKVVVVPPA